MKKKEMFYDHINELPVGRASDALIDGCMVLEGGAWRGLYTQGVLDVLMQNDINLQSTIGVSAGAMAGMNYVSGQIGRSIRINLTYRHSQDYVGLGAMKNDHGITGFSYLWNTISPEYPLDEKRFSSAKKDFTVVATDIETAKAHYFEKGICSDMEKAVQASATVPYISEPVEIEGKEYLDGGITDPIPYQWALNREYEKIVVVRTRDRSYRKEGSSFDLVTKREYRKYPALVSIMEQNTERYNNFVEELNQLEEEGRLFVIAPSKPIMIPRFEGDLEKLADVYRLGYQDGKTVIESLKKYLMA